MKCFLRGPHRWSFGSRPAALSGPIPKAPGSAGGYLLREGKYAAEVSVELIEEEGGWSPYLSLDDARKLDSVKLALRRGDIAEASKYGRVFELMPISA